MAPIARPDTRMPAPSERPERTGFGVPLDGAILERARRGDTTAFAAIYSLYGRACYNLALRMLAEPAAAEDVVQDVFIKLMEGLRGFRGDAPFGAWLKRMAANAAVDRLRARRAFDGEDFDESTGAFAVDDAPADARVDAWTLLMRLSPRARAVLVLHELEGYTHRELGEMFGQSESFSKSVLHRTLQRLGRAEPDASADTGS
jgi:RNA polymerase sigma-70 factor (ECF subfamily)